MGGRERWFRVVLGSAVTEEVWMGRIGHGARGRGWFWEFGTPDSGEVVLVGFGVGMDLGGMVGRIRHGAASGMASLISRCVLASL